MTIPARLRATLCSLLSLCLLAGLAASARAAEGVDEESATIWSEGVRLQATLYRPHDVPLPLPTVIASHGWGGTAALLRPQATDMARAGFLVIVFDYRGWGPSEARLRTPPQGEVPVPVREVVDPLDQGIDLLNVIHWAMGDARVDPARVGLWGTSFSGGLVVFAAARDPRIRALVSQVGYLGTPLARMSAAALAKARAEATARARGELDFPAPGRREVGNLRGAPLREKFLLYAPIDEVAQARQCAMLFIAAEHEELFDNREHPQLAYERAAGPKQYVVIPGIAHYGIYNEAREEATRLAVAWFKEHLHP